MYNVFFNPSNWNYFGSEVRLSLPQCHCIIFEMSACRGCRFRWDWHGVQSNVNFVTSGGLQPERYYATSCLHSLGSAENQRFRHFPRSLGFPQSALILSANQYQICVQTARFSMELYLIGSHHHMTLLVSVAVSIACACVCHNAKFSLFCASKSFLTASYFF